MQFMKVYDRPDLVSEAQFCFGDVVGVFAQNDTWDVHLFVLSKSGSLDYEVAMLNVRKEDRGILPEKGDLVEALHDADVDDTGEYGSLGEALDTIVQYGDLVSENESFKSTLGAVNEAEDVARMSKYARKQFLRDKGVTLDEYVAALPDDAKVAYRRAGGGF